MCEYCNEDFDGYVKPLDKNGHVAVFDKPHEKILDIDWYGHKMRLPISYCPMCWQKVRWKMKHITLKEMFNILIDCILNNKEQPFFYYKRENEYILIQEVDLMDSRLRTTDGDFTEYEWELEESRLYKEDKQ